MQMKKFGKIGIAVLAMALANTSIAADAPSEPGVEAKFPADQLAFYEKQVKPILVASCLKCHGAKPKIKGGLNMTNRTGLIKGGDTGSALDAKAPTKSLLLSAISYQEEFLEMPPKGKLPQNQIDTLTKWTQMGMPMPAGGGTSHVESGHVPQITDETKNHWSFRPVRPVAVPNVKDRSWVRNPIDAFILARLEANGLTPNAHATKAALIRRAYFDLIGLPPSPKRVDAFIENKATNAYAELIDELLAMPQYGEKWARHWLDLVHYAESNSYERDNPKPEVWRYRDYVIQSFNSDKPYSQFIREQLAGDELEELTPASVIATGYYRLGVWDDESADPPQSRYDELDDWVTVTSQVMLGLTMDCARCHDHKLDPIPQKDYYRFVAFFRDIGSFQNGRDGMSKGFSAGNFHLPLSQFIPADKLKQSASKLYFDSTELDRANDDLKRMQKEISKKLPGGVVDDFNYEANRLTVVKEQKKLLGNGLVNRYIKTTARRDQLQKAKDANDAKVLGIKPDKNPAPTHLMIRGNPHSPGDEVQPGFPQVLGFPEPTIPAPSKDARSTGRRTVLANWIASDKNPLTARVMVNRVWQHHFGDGLVASTSNFGLTGDKPTHPKLLDWLANALVKNGWRFKSLHKQIMLSNAYQMSSGFNKAAYEKDPKNQMIWGFKMRRLGAEEIRDTILAVSGKLNLKMHGPSIYPVIPKEVLAGQSRPGANWRTSNETEGARRSVYIHIKRSLGVPMIESFDGADTDNTCPVRFVTTQPTQALGMLNSDFMSGQAEKLALRLKSEVGTNPKDQIARAIELATQRKASDRDIQRGLALFNELKKEEGVSDAQAMKYYCLMVYNLNEFMYVD